MTTSPSKTDDAIPAKRPWRHLHRSTWIVILLMTGFFVIVEIPGEPECAINSEGLHWGGGGRIFGHNSLHGWPWVFLVHDRNDNSNAPIDVPWLTALAWNWSSEYPPEFSLVNAILDLAVCLAIIAAVAIAFEWRRRRRTRLLQFTLRELLLLTLLTAAAFSWWRMHHAQREREMAIVKLLEEYPYCDSFGEDEYRGPIIFAKLFGKSLLSDFWSSTQYVCGDDVSPRDAEKRFSGLSELPNLETIDCRSRSAEEPCVTDALFGKLASLKHVRCLKLRYANISDAGMETISRFHELRDLDLCGTAVTTAGIRHLKATPLLEFLYLRDTQIDDAAIETLAALENLKVLDLSGTKVTDKSIPLLRQRLPHLFHLDISRTRISEEGAQKLKAMLPAAGIERVKH
jgi:hypothetical protein